MTLAVVAPGFSEVSETFVADHVRTLAPGATVLVCRDSYGAEAFRCPVLSHLRPRLYGFSPIDRRLKSLLVLLRQQFGPALPFEDRMRLIEFFRRQRVNRVLAEFGPSGVMVADVCSRIGVPLWVYFRGADATSAARHAGMRRRYRRMFGQVEGVFCVSEHLADRLVAIGCPRELIAINPSGVPIDAFPAGEPDPFRIVSVGRLVDKKAPHLTIEAFARIAKRFPCARLDLVGQGPLHDLCMQTIARFGLAGRVVLHGALPNDEVAALLRRASIFALHSRTASDGDMEGFPTAIAEAMSTALCVVSTRHSGIIEHIEEGVSGLLVAEGDVEGMAQALARTLADPAYARRLGAAARAHAIAHLDRERARERVRAAMGLAAPEIAGLPRASVEATPRIRPPGAVRRVVSLP